MDASHKIVLFWVKNGHFVPALVLMAVAIFLSRRRIYVALVVLIGFLLGMLWSPITSKHWSVSFLDSPGYYENAMEDAIPTLALVSLGLLIYALFLRPRLVAAQRQPPDEES